MIINNLNLGLDEDIDVLKFLASKKLNVSVDKIKHFKLIKKSVDARDKNDIHFVCSVIVDTKPAETVKPILKQIKSGIRPVVCGFGPAGMFAALTLAEAGLKPIVLERGSNIEIRQRKVAEFWKYGNLDENSNVQFGEGGAGSFSDGKLTTGINNPLCGEVIRILIENGAPQDIEYLGKPHIGTDLLPAIVKNIRNKILSLGGEILFDNALTGIEIKNGRLNKVEANTRIETPVLILAAGHSAYDVFKMLYEKGVNIVQKPFSVGFRIEHLQSFINKAQYGKFSGHPNLPKAEYKFSFRDQSGNSAYTFCMCPGGYVVASSSVKGGIVTNGMSENSRGGLNANSAVLVNVDGADFLSSYPLAGIEYQKEIESKAFIMADKTYNAPCQLLDGFLNNKVSKGFTTVQPTYKPSVAFCNLNKLFSDRVLLTLKNAILSMNNKLRGFADGGAILTAPETRSSSPVKILRDSQTLQTNFAGIYPCGEGSGYAGGIMSSAVDGIRIASKVIQDITNL